MILTCPQCATRYQANDAAFPPGGRRVRCAKCGHNWHQEPPAAEPEQDASPPPPEPEPTPEPVARHAAYAPAATAFPEDIAAEVPPRQAGMGVERLAMAGGWIGLVLVLLLIGWSAVAYRQAVAGLWPASATLYSTLGLPVNARGLAFSDISYRRETEDKQSVLAVTGKLINVSGRELAVPQILAILTGEDGRELYRWNFAPDVATLGAGRSVKFLTRVSRPPAGARHLELKLADFSG